MNVNAELEMALEDQICNSLRLAVGDYYYRSMAFEKVQVPWERIQNQMISYKNLLREAVDP